MSQRHGDWIQTFTGRAFWPLDPQVEDIDPDDVAHALALICRYGGHCQRFFSVAEHCVLLSHAVRPENALWALLHDATEAYLLDLPYPIKVYMPDYRAAEQRLMEVICQRFRLDPRCPAEVKEADLRIRCDERAALLAAAPMPWASLEHVTPLGVQIEGWAPGEAEDRYRTRLKDLTGGRL